MALQVFRQAAAGASARGERSQVPLKRQMTLLIRSVAQSSVASRTVSARSAKGCKLMISKELLGWEAGIRTPIPWSEPRVLRGRPPNASRGAMRRRELPFRQSQRTAAAPGAGRLLIVRPVSSRGHATVPELPVLAARVRVSAGDAIVRALRQWLRPIMVSGLEIGGTSLRARSGSCCSCLGDDSPCRPCGPPARLFRSSTRARCPSGAPPFRPCSRSRRAVPVDRCEGAILFCHATLLALPCSQTLADKTNVPRNACKLMRR